MPTDPMTDTALLFEILDHCSTAEKKARWAATCSAVLNKKPGKWSEVEFAAAVNAELAARGLSPLGS